MAQFFGKEFIYNDVPSSDYGIRILNFESGKSESNAGAEVTIYEDYIYRKSRSNYYGRTANIPLEITLTIGSYDGISGIDRNVIQAWLLSSMNYQKFQIVQEDLQDVYWNVIFTKMSNVFVGNVNQAFVLTGHCDSGFAWENSQILTKSYPTGFAIETFNFYNSSADADFNYPVITFDTDGQGWDFILTNNSDGGRECIFLFQPSNATITMDNYNEILTSSTGLNVLSKFNLHWFRLIPGLNSIGINARITSFTMTTQFLRKIGG